MEDTTGKPLRTFVDVQNEAIKVLETVYDPEIPVNIYELGLIYEVNVSVDLNIEIVMSLTSPFCPAAQSMPAEIKEKLPKLGKDVDGVYIKRRLFFQNKIIKYGRLSPVKLLRLFRFQKGFSDNRWVDEKIIIEGKSSIFNEYMIDHNLKSINYWIQKHNQYSSNEALNFLLLKYNSFFDKTTKFKEYFNSTNQVNLIKRNIYLKLPLIIRAFVVFFFRYFFCLGFLNGKSGIIYYFLRFLWYPLLVDIKIIEVKVLLKNNIKIEDAIKKILQINIDNV